MRICILGIAGTFMTGIACLAKAMGHQVWGMDQSIYPPMSDVLAEHEIQCFNGYDIAHLQDADYVIIGNAISRGNACLEYVLDQKIEYYSGAEWLFQSVLKHRKVIAITGTHGKTTCTHMLVHLLKTAGMHCGYLIAGQPKDNLPMASLGDESGLGYFVIEADEYDTAFFDKQPKFLKYRAHHVLINNIEYDHADIYDSIDAIYVQFSRLVKQVPSSGRIYIPNNDVTLQKLVKSAYANVVTLGQGGDMQCQEGSLHYGDKRLGSLSWKIPGRHMLDNALAVSAIALDCGADAQSILTGLESFQGVKRRMHPMGRHYGIEYIDDFAHHPTAIAKTLSAVKPDSGLQMVIVRPTNYTQREMLMERSFIESLSMADQAIVISDQWKYDSSTISTVSSIEEALMLWRSKSSQFSQCVTMSAKSMQVFYEGIVQNENQGV